MMALFWKHRILCCQKWDGLVRRRWLTFLGHEQGFAHNRYSRELRLLQMMPSWLGLPRNSH